MRAAARAHDETRAEQALDDIRGLRVQLSNGESRLEDGLWRIQQAYERKVAFIAATTLGSQGVSMYEHIDQAKGSRAIGEPSERYHLKVDDGGAAELDEALKELREIKESLSAIDRAVEAAFVVIDQQFKRLQQRVITAMYQRPEGGASDAG